MKKYLLNLSLIWILILMRPYIMTFKLYWINLTNWLNLLMLININHYLPYINSSLCKNWAKMPNLESKIKIWRVFTLCNWRKRTKESLKLIDQEILDVVEKLAHAQYFDITNLLAYLYTHDLQYLTLPSQFNLTNNYSFPLAWIVYPRDLPCFN